MEMESYYTGVQRMLIVEDEPQITDTCCVDLMDEGFEVDVARNGTIAQGMIERHTYDVILVDLGQPQFGGRELYEWLRKKLPPMTRRVIFTGENSTDKDVQNFLDETGRPFLHKPFTSDELMSKVREIMRLLKRTGTILVVDDEVYIRRLIQRILEGAGFSVVTAANGEEALRTLAEGNITLVLLDIMMPGIDGLGVLALIREKYDIPVIMVSGKGEVATLRDSLQLGADDYIRKPFHPRELLARIDAKLRRYSAISD